jgi:hypothetical protein
MPEKIGANSVLGLLHSVIVRDSADVEDSDNGGSMCFRNVGVIANNYNVYSQRK